MKEPGGYTLYSPEEDTDCLSVQTLLDNRLGKEWNGSAMIIVP